LGYTHYIETAATVAAYKFSLAKFAELKVMLKQILLTASQEPWHIETEINADDKETFYFNGIEDDGHETLCAIRDVPGFNFCKTARKPYDTCVTASLLLLNLVSKDDLIISSDGDREDWLDGFRLLNHALPGIYSQYPTHLPEGEFNFALTDKELVALKLRTKLDLKAASKTQKKAIILCSEAGLSKLSLLKAGEVPIIRATAEVLNVELVRKVRELDEGWGLNGGELEVTLPYLLQGLPLLADLLYLAALESEPDVVAIVGGSQAKVLKRLVTISKQQTVINLDLDVETASPTCFYSRLVNYQDSMGTLEQTLALLPSRVIWKTV
jgi:hypothetical protein